MLRKMTTCRHECIDTLPIWILFRMMIIGKKEIFIVRILHYCGLNFVQVFDNKITKNEKEVLFSVWWIVLIQPFLIVDIMLHVSIVHKTFINFYQNILIILLTHFYLCFYTHCFKDFKKYNNLSLISAVGNYANVPE